MGPVGCPRSAPVLERSTHDTYVGTWRSPMTAQPRLTVLEAGGRRSVSVERVPFSIGRGSGMNLQLASRDVSKQHAEIFKDGDQFMLRDVGSRFGTFVNGEQVLSSRVLAHGDRIQLGRSQESELIFDDEKTSSHITSFSDASGLPDLPQMTEILNGLRAIGSGRVLDEVLILVLQSALKVTTADRGFIMLANDRGVLEFQVACDRDGRLPPGTFETSEKIPRSVYETGRAQILDLREVALAGGHDRTLNIGIGYVHCVPLTINRMGSGEQSDNSGQTIGVLYLDSRRTEMAAGNRTRSTLEAFATQAALAIESARLYAEEEVKKRMERDLHVAAEIQRAMLPDSHHRGATYELAARSIPCRTIGGDFFDYTALDAGRFGFALGDVAGKGPPAALLAAAVQSNLAAQALAVEEPSRVVTGVNRALLRRAVAARFATLFYGMLEADGRLAYCNAGQEPPLIVRSGGRVDDLDSTGPIVGILDLATFDTAAASLENGDLLIVCSDGVTEASNTQGEEFGRDRIADFARARHGESADRLLADLIAAVTEFVGTAQQADDLTALVLRYQKPD